MVLEIHAHPGSSRNEIIEKDGVFHVYVTTRPEKNAANKDIIQLISKYRKIPKSRIRITSGLTSRKKRILID